MLEYLFYVWRGDSGGIVNSYALYTDGHLKQADDKILLLKRNFISTSYEDVTMATSIKVMRPNPLTEGETLTSFEDWKNNLNFYLSQDKDLKRFLKPETTWSKTSADTSNRGLESEELHQHLSHFLGVIADLCPPLLYNDIIDDTTKTSDIFKLLRTYYQFAPSESTFIKFANIKREVKNGTSERPLHLYLRLRQFIRDNLLLSSGKIEHNGSVPTKDEVISPTTERLVVLRWLEILHPALPGHVANVFAQDLQTKSLKDLQPRINEQIEDLLFQVHNKSDDPNVDLSYAKFSTNNARFKVVIPLKIQILTQSKKYSLEKCLIAKRAFNWSPW